MMAATLLLILARHLQAIDALKAQPSLREILLNDIIPQVDDIGRVVLEREAQLVEFLAYVLVVLGDGFAGVNDAREGAGEFVVFVDFGEDVRVEGFDFGL